MPEDDRYSEGVARLDKFLRDTQPLVDKAQQPAEQDDDQADTGQEADRG